MDDRTRTQLLVASLVGVAVAAVLASFVYGIAVPGTPGNGLHVADVEGAWTAEGDSRARLLIRADGSAEVTGEGQVKGCAALMWGDGRTAEATWVFGDTDDPRTVHLRLPGPDTASGCSFDLVVDDSGTGATSPAPPGAAGGRWVRGDTPH